MPGVQGSTAQEKPGDSNVEQYRATVLSLPICAALGNIYSIRFP